MVLLEKQLDVLERYGFTRFEPFGPNSYAIIAVPAYCRKGTTGRWCSRWWRNWQR